MREGVAGGIGAGGLQWEWEVALMGVGVAARRKMGGEWEGL